MDHKLLDCILSVVTNEDNEPLTRPSNEDEVKDAAF